MRARLLHAPERLDDERHDASVLEHSLRHVAQVNRFLGGTRAILRSLEPLFAHRRDLRILDVGTATADIPRAIVDNARHRGIRVSIVATDLHPQMRELAAAACVAYPEITIDAADARALAFADRSFDAVTLSLTLHHFEDDDPVTVLREAGRVGGVVIVNELERGWMNYIGARLLAATWWRTNPLTRHDGPLSVLRAFTADELRDIARRAGLRDITIRRAWFFRIIVTARGSIASA